MLFGCVARMGSLRARMKGLRFFLICRISDRRRLWLL